jgi:hypothetical protein
LQLANLLRSNADIAQFADASGHGVSDAILINQFFYHLARSQHLLSRVRRKQHRTLLVHNFAQIRERELFSVDV